MLELKILPYPLNIAKNADENVMKNVDKIDKSIDLLLPPPWEEGTKLTVTPSSKGKIKTLLFVLPKDAEVKVQYHFFPVLKELIQKMPHVENFIIIHRGYELDLDPAFKKWLIHHLNVHLKTIRDEKHNAAKGSELSIWAQDHFYTLKAISPNQTTPQIHGMVGKIDKNFLFALNRVVNSTTGGNILPDFQLQKTGLSFEGGNILVGDGFMLVGDGFMLVGADAFESSIYELFFGIETISVRTDVSPPMKKSHSSKDGFHNSFPAPSTSTTQPIFHIDMFLTLVGFNQERTTYTIVVGQPRLGVETLQEIDYEFYLVLNNWLTQMQASICSCIENLKASFKDRLDVDLNIVSIPLVLIYNDIVDRDTKKREWFWASYNNCLVENKSTSQTVWLPSYGSDKSNYAKKDIVPISLVEDIQYNLNTKIPITYGDWRYLDKHDKESKSTWETLGFEAHLLEQNYIPFARERGSLNCFTNCIER